MYCAALAAGVPFDTLGELRLSVKNALFPSQPAVNAFNAYMKAANVARGPVEEMTQAHMGHYFTYRYQARRKPYSHPSAQPYYQRPFFKKASAEHEFLKDSQQHFIAALAVGAVFMDEWMKRGKFSGHLEQPFQTFAPGALLAGYLPIAARRAFALMDRHDTGDLDQNAHLIAGKVQTWKNWLSERAIPVLRDPDSPERDFLTVLEGISEAPQPAAIYEFFDHWVHDSMAGLASDGVNEFLLNGIGLAKFRRTYFGNNGDQMLRERTAASNEVARAAAAQRRKRRA